MEDQDQIILDKLLEKHNILLVEHGILLKEHEKLLEKYETQKKINSNLLDRSAIKDTQIKDQHQKLMDAIKANIEFRRNKYAKQYWSIFFLIIFALFNAASGIRYLFKIHRLNQIEKLLQIKPHATDSIDTSQML